jgi:uncharacterized membrane protein YkvA (DUF1232 family)
VLAKLKQWSRMRRRDAHAICLAARDPRVPWYAKALAIAVAAYAFSPIDLIPDFIPVLGYVDDLVIVPLGIALVMKLIPAELMAEHRARVTAMQDRPLASPPRLLSSWPGLRRWPSRHSQPCGRGEAGEQSAGVKGSLAPHTPPSSGARSRPVGSQ